jgi:hypothetical protein
LLGEGIAGWRTKKNPLSFAILGAERPKLNGEVFLQDDRLAIQQGWPVTPLRDCIDRRRNEQVRPVQRFHVFDRAVCRDRRPQLHRAAHSFLLGLRRISGRHFRNAFTDLEPLGLMAGFRPRLRRDKHELVRVNFDHGRINYPFFGQYHEPRHVTCGRRDDWKK